VTRRLRLAGPGLATPRPRKTSGCGAHRLLLPAVGPRAGLTPLLPAPPPSLTPPPTTSRPRKPDLRAVIPSVTRRRRHRETAPRAARPAPRPRQRSRPTTDTTPTSATPRVIPPAPPPRPALTLSDRNSPGPGRILIIVAVCVVLSAILFGPPRVAARVAGAVAERLTDRHPPDDGPW
jgi:hypothetical protein